MFSLLRSMNSVSNKHSNLECFLDSVTPSVPQQPLPKSSITDLNALWKPHNKEVTEFFTLGDLWKCYNEWSAYGAGVPVTLNTGETVVQYYVPYLSAIQIFTSKTYTTLSTRSSQEDSCDRAECESDSLSDESEGDKLSRSLSSNSTKFWDAMSEDSSFERESTLSMTDQLGCLYHQYFEMASPYWRVPLTDKITEMAQTYPGLLSLRNVDLSPASWMAVSWYPIYHIPSGRNMKDLTASFLTYHTLSSCFQDDDTPEDENLSLEANGDEVIKSKAGIRLSPFGLATYKMDGEIWLNPEKQDDERMYMLQSAADSWLKQLRVYHHDFNYFISRSAIL